MATKKQIAKDKETVKFWLLKIEKAKKVLKGFHEQADKANKAVRDDDDELKHSFNIHWSSCAIIRAAIYASRPKPDVRRRYQKPDPEEKELARLVERAIEYNLDVYDFETPSNRSVKDYVETGLGVPRLIYDVKTTPILGPAGEPITDPESGEPLTEIASQSVGAEHIPWKQFLWEPGKAWVDVEWVAFKTFKSKKEIEDEYGVSLKGGKDDETKLKADDYTDLATVWEIWHKPSKTVYVICPNYAEAPLDEYPDPLELAGFFPVPQPLMANVKFDELIPKPDYCFVEAQLKQINRIAHRTYELTNYIKDVSFYDAGLSAEIGNLLNQGDGAMVPVTNLAGTMEALGGGNGWDGAILSAPNDRKIQVVRELQVQLQEAKEQLYEVYGISDIVRGASKASETATAQQIKAQYANVRLNEKQGAVAMLWRNFFRMMAEVICERFDDMQLYLMTGIQVTPKMREIMDNDIGRTFAIDIETDSTIAQDDLENKKQTMEMIETVISLLERLIPGVQSGALPAELVQETLSLAVSTHKHAKNLDDAIQGIGPHLQGLQDFQQQMGQMQEQLQQAQMQNQQMQQELGKVNERKEAREDMKVKIDATKAQADSADKNVDNTRANEVATADIGLKEAQTIKTLRDTQQVVGFG